MVSKKEIKASNNKVARKERFPWIAEINHSGLSGFYEYLIYFIVNV